MCDFTETSEPASPGAVVFALGVVAACGIAFWVALTCIVIAAVAA